MNLKLKKVILIIQYPTTSLVSPPIEKTYVQEVEGKGKKDTRFIDKTAKDVSRVYPGIDPKTGKYSLEVNEGEKFTGDSVEYASLAEAVQRLKNPIGQSMEDLVSLCKRRGFIFQSNDIYGGMKGLYDFGPMGVELKMNLKNSWWRSIVYERESSCS